MHVIWKDNIKKNIMSQKAIFYFTTLFLILMVYSYLSIGNQTNTASIKIDLVYNYHIFFYKMTIYLLIIPCFLLLLLDILNFFNHNMVILRFVKIRNWWSQKFISIISLSILFALFLNISLALMFIVKGLSIELDFVFLILTGLFYQIIGFSIIGSLFEIFSCLMKNKYIGIIVTYLFILIPLAIKGLFFKEIYFFVDFMFLLNVKNINEITFSLSTVLPLLTLSLIILLFTCYKLNKNQDLYWVDENHA